MRVQFASDYFELACHVLCHVPPAGPTPLHFAATLYDEDYLASCHGRYDRSALPELARDPELVSRLWAQLSVSELMGIANLPYAHKDIPAFARRASVPLFECVAGAGDDPSALGALRAAPSALAEIVRCDMALCAPSFSTGWARWTEEVSLVAYAQALSAAAALVPALEGFEISMSSVLGHRGRVRDRDIVVGLCSHVPKAAGSSAVVALHECAVAGVAINRPDLGEQWAPVEAVALEALGPVLEGSWLSGPYERWAGRLDRSGLVAADPEAVAATQAWLVRAPRRG